MAVVYFFFLVVC